MKAKIVVLMVIAVLASAGITYMVMNKKLAGGHAGEGEAIAPAGGLKIAGLQFAKAVAGAGWDTVTVTGKVVIPHDRLVKISPRIEGKIVAAHGTVGDTVRRGQTLAVISSVDLAEARAQYRKALSTLAASQMNLQREMEMARLGATSVRPVEEARRESLSAQGELADSKSELSQAEGELAQCKARLQRARELYADQIVSKQDVETAETEFKRDSSAVESATSRVTQAEAKSEIAKQYLAREEKVYKGRVLDMRAVQSARSEVASAQVEAQSAADRIRVLGASPSGSGDTIALVSPISGRIIARNTNIGQMASPADAIFTVADQSQVWIEADVYEKDIAKIRKGQRAEIRIDAYPNKVFSGRIDAVSDVLSPESRTAKVRCVVPNAQGLLRGEMFARISLVTGMRGAVVLIPKEAVLDDAGKKIIFTPCAECPEDIKAGTNACGAYDKFEVRTGAVHGNDIEVLTGLEPGTLVVTVGAFQLKTALGSGQLEAGCADGH